MVAERSKHCSHSGPPADLLATRLSAFAPVLPAEVKALAGAATGTREHPREQVIAQPGHRPADLRLVVGGVVGRIKTTWRGQRQIVAVYLPGEVIDWPLFRVNVGRPEGDRWPLEDAIWSLSDCAITTFRGPLLQAALEAHPTLARAFEGQALADQGIGREWLLNIAARPAAERVGHLLCELYHRMQAVGLAAENACHLPLTQAHLSEALGLTPVHINRVLQRMRADGLVTFNAGTLSLLDARRLELFADFAPDYLRL